MKQTILGQRLRQMRQKQGHTQKSLAYIAKVQPSTISRIENGYTSPDFVSLGVLWGLAMALNITIDYLVGYDTVPEIGERPMDDTTFELSGIYQGLSWHNKCIMRDFARYLEQVEDYETKRDTGEKRQEKHEL